MIRETTKIRIWLNWWFQYDLERRKHINKISEIFCSREEQSAEERLDAMEMAFVEFATYIKNNDDTFEDLWHHTFGDLSLKELFNQYKENKLFPELEESEDMEAESFPDDEMLHELFPKGTKTPIDLFGLVFLNNDARKIQFILN